MSLVSSLYAYTPKLRHKKRCNSLGFVFCLFWGFLFLVFIFSYLWLVFCLWFWGFMMVFVCWVFGVLLVSFEVVVLFYLRLLVGQWDVETFGTDFVLGAVDCSTAIYQHIIWIRIALGKKFSWGIASYSHRSILVALVIPALMWVE